MPRNILVPLDGTAFGEAVLPEARRIARGSNAVLHIVRVHVAPANAPLSLEGTPLTDPEQDDACWEAERAYVRWIRSRLGPRSKVPARIAVLPGPVVEALANYASINRVDLIVMSTHGRQGLARAWQGSEADALMRSCRLPVVLVRPSGNASTLVPAPLTQGPAKIVIALDGSALAEEVVEATLDVGSAMDAEYVLLRVVKPFGVSEDLASVFAPAMGRVMAEEHAAGALTYLTEIAWWMRDRGLRVETSVIVSERPAEIISSEATRLGASLVAMATHGRSGLPRMLMGSVAGEVLRRATVPLLLYRPKVGAVRRHRKPALVRQRQPSASP
jgi:nucleotide-binding universal stress UspA family protein